MDLRLLQNSTIFHDMTEDEISTAIDMLRTKKSEYKKGDTILCAGSSTSAMGMVLDGSVTIENNDI